MSEFDRQTAKELVAQVSALTSKGSADEAVAIVHKKLEETAYARFGFNDKQVIVQQRQLIARYAIALEDLDTMLSIIDDMTSHVEWRILKEMRTRIDELRKERELRRL